MASTDPNLALTYGWAFRESGWKDGMDANLKKLGAVVQLAVLSMTTDVPGAPADGDRYIIPAGATGAWTGLDGQIAVRVAGAWEYYAPSEGWRAWVADRGRFAVFASSAWVLHDYPLWADPPATASSAGVPGQMARDGSYLYICIAADTWLRAAISTW